MSITRLFPRKSLSSERPRDGHAILSANQNYISRSRRKPIHCTHLRMAERFYQQQRKQTEQGPLHYNHAVEISIRSPPLGYVVNSHCIRHTYRFKEDVKRYDPLLDSLERALSKPLFCCGGRLQPQDMKEFFLKVLLPTSEEVSDADTVWEEFKLANLPVDKLLELSKPAPFGDLKQMQTVLDSEVRLAYEIESQRFQIGTEGQRVLKCSPERFPGDYTSIENHIESTLTPGRYVRLDRYKLNVYNEGGFFKPHVDTPKEHNMIGTLVICLPSPHKGGELCVNHDGLQHVFDFSVHSGDTSMIQWAAFYSDCVHEVKPVLEGHRVTVTYNITLPDQDFWKRKSRWRSNRDWKDPVPPEEEEHFEASAESPSLSTKVLNDVNSELEKIRHQRGSALSRIGFLLKYKYTSKGLQPRLLKGEDKVLFDFLIENQWECKIMSVLSRYQTCAASPYGTYEDRELDESHEIYEFNPLSTTPAPFIPLHPKPFLPDFRKWRVGIPFIDIYRRAEAGEQLLRDKEGKGEWLGNEVEDVGVDKIYLDSAVIVEL